MKRASGESLPLSYMASCRDMNLTMILDIFVGALWDDRSLYEIHMESARARAQRRRAWMITISKIDSWGGFDIRNIRPYIVGVVSIECLCVLRRKYRSRFLTRPYCVNEEVLLDMFLLRMRILRVYISYWVLEYAWLLARDKRSLRLSPLIRSRV